MSSSTPSQQPRPDKALAMLRLEDFKQSGRAIQAVVGLLMAYIYVIVAEGIGAAASLERGLLLPLSVLFGPLLIVAGVVTLLKLKPFGRGFTTGLVIVVVGSTLVGLVRALIRS